MSSYAFPFPTNPPTYPTLVFSLTILKHQKSPRLPRVQAAVAAAILQLVRQNASGREACARKERAGAGRGRAVSQAPVTGLEAFCKCNTGKACAKALEGPLWNQAAPLPREEDG